MTDTQDDTQTFVDDGAITLRFGDRTVTEPALKVRASAKWSREVQRTLQAGMAAMRRIQEAKTNEEITAAADAAAEGAGLDRVIDLLVAHGIPEATVEEGTAKQCMEAFAALYRLENPQMTAAAAGGTKAI